MTCQQCERKLGLGENPEEHLAGCAACRSFAEEMRLNADAMAAFRGDPLPSLIRPLIRRGHSRWVAVAAIAAAAIFMMLRVSVDWRRSPLPHSDRIAMSTSPRLDVPVEKTIAPKRHRVHRAVKVAAPAEPLKVKMLTSDPDVVIYWLIDKKEGIE